MKFLFVLLLCSPFILSAQVSLKKGMLINQSVTITAGAYFLDADTGAGKSLIVIEGKNIVVDFNHAILKSNADAVHPNYFTGVAILIKKGSSNIVLKNANIHGYKIAVMAENVSGLTIEQCDFSYNYRQQLHSNWKREDISDWMSFHHNENNEWFRYGAGIYLKHCNKAIIKNNTISNGQCGLLMSNCDNAEIFDNNFSFNSALGIGMYRSSNNHIYRNRLDFNVRGFSFGKYYRGQDSAGMLVFEQCSNNIFAYNSATHSGDGFFLWAGQYTMDTGEGGCNDNILYNNDFSYAPTNGVELTFSRNLIKRNIINGCDNGVWGGYSYQTAIEENNISGNKTAIAIEHGQQNQIIGNTFSKNSTAIKLWSRETQPADWGYAQKRNTSSKNYSIKSNSFLHEQTVYDIMGTDTIMFSSNSKDSCRQIYKLGVRINALDTTQENNNAKRKQTGLAFPFITKKTIPVNSFPYGRNQIRITEWGPYNFGYPFLFLDSVSSGNYHFTVFHPGGEWKQSDIKGFTVISSGKDMLVARADSTVQNRLISLQYNGRAFTDLFGKQHAAGKPYRFGFNEFDPLCNWNINFYQWDKTNDPGKDYQQFVGNLLKPVLSVSAKEIDYTWWGAIGSNLPKDSFATVASTTMNLPAGNYEIGVTGDDMVKLFIDDKEVIDAWDKKFTLLDENTHHSIHTQLAGKHVFKLVHAEVDGLADLVFYLKPVEN